LVQPQNEVHTGALIEHDMNRKKKNQAIRYNNGGNLCYKHRQHKDAILLYTKAIELCPDVSAFYGNRGQAYYQIRLFQQAIEDSNMSTELDPTFWKGYIRAGKCSIRLGNLKDAAAYFTKAKDLCQNLAEVVQVANFEMGKLADTKKSLEEAMRLYRATNYGSAIQALQALATVISHGVDVHLVLADSYCQQKQYQSVLKLVEKAKNTFKLSDEDTQKFTVLQMRAFGSMTAQRWGVHDRAHKRWQDDGGSTRQSLYTVLGVTPHATQVDISGAYTDLALKYHPERQPETLDEQGLRGVTQKYLDATEAFIILSDTETRELYDLGVSPAKILSEDIDPYTMLCGLPQQGSNGMQKCLQTSVNLACTPVITMTAGISWLTKRLSESVTCQEQNTTWEDEKISLLHMQRKQMLQAARQQAGSAASRPHNPTPPFVHAGESSTT